MDVQYLVDRIIKDAQAEAKAVLKDAKTNAKENIEYAKKRATEIIENAVETAKKNKQRETEILQGARDIQNRLCILKQKTKIVDDVFESAMNDIKFKFRVEDHQDYELRLTKQEITEHLRDNIENQVASTLFSEASGE